MMRPAAENLPELRAVTDRAFIGVIPHPVVPRRPLCNAPGPRGSSMLNKRHVFLEYASFPPPELWASLLELANPSNFSVHWVFF